MTGDGGVGGVGGRGRRDVGVGEKGRRADYGLLVDANCVELQYISDKMG